MKRVLKGTEPASFTHWKALENDDWRPTYPILRDPQKSDLLKALLEEQGHFCCYCGRDITSHTSHIEHFKPQEQYRDQDLDFQNLHASCIRERLPEHPLHCGHKKGHWFDEDLHIAPTSEDCEQRFRYLLNGEIQATHPTDNAAAKMIEVLALDIHYLNNRREQALQRFFDDAFLVQVSQAELRKVVEALRSTPVAVQTSFDHVIARQAEQLLTP